MRFVMHSIPFYQSRAKSKPTVKIDHIMAIYRVAYVTCGFEMRKKNREFFDYIKVSVC